MLTTPKETAIHRFALVFSLPAELDAAARYGGPERHEISIDTCNKDHKTCEPFDLKINCQIMNEATYYKIGRLEAPVLLTSLRCVASHMGH
jgi:hypothetical protein